MTASPASSTHQLLRRQLARLGLREDAPPPGAGEWSMFLARVSASYAEADQDRHTMQRSLDSSSGEMQQVYQDLRSSQAELALQRGKLERSLVILDVALDASLDGVLVVDQHRKIVKLNRRFLEIWNVPDEVAANVDEALPVHCIKLLADPEATMRRVEEIMGDPKASISDEILLGDGRILERFSAPVMLPTGSSFGRVWFFRDVTSRRRDEEEVRQMSRFLDSIVENIPDMIFVKDADSLRFVRVNRAGEDLIGLGREELLGKTDADFFPPHEAELYLAKDRELLGAGKMFEIAEEPIETRHKGRRVLHTKKLPIPDRDGRPRYLLGISRDITDAKQTERELREAKEAAEEASRAKTRFLANMSHEMRTPLNSILGFARVLEAARFGPLGEQQREYVAYILRAGQHMLNLVDDLLDLRRLEEDRYSLATTRIGLGQLVAEALALVKALTDEKGHTVAVELPTELPDALADRRAVLQILVNLLSNAAKFTPDSGRIIVRASATGDRLNIAVEDCGIGIRPEDQPRLFTYFEQLGARHEHGMRGSGVGLALTRSLVEKLGGAIKVTSAVGVGSTFEFSIPRWTELAGHGG